MGRFARSKLLLTAIGVACATATLAPAGDGVAMIELKCPKAGVTFCSGPLSLVELTYMVRNSGDVPVFNLQVQDNLCGMPTFLGGDDNENEVLDPGEIWVYECVLDLEDSVRVEVVAQGDTPLGPVEEVCMFDVVALTTLDVTIVGPAELCPGKSVVYDTTASGSPSFEWQIAGNGQIVTSPSGSSVEVQADPACDGFILLTVTVTEDGDCVGEDSLAIAVSDDDPPEVVKCPPDPVIVPPSNAFMPDLVPFAGAMDACDTELSGMQMPAAGAPLAAGLNPVAISFEDDCGNAAGESIGVCVPPPGDANCDFIINVDDVVAVIINWGPCGGGPMCVGDLDGNQQVDVDDLVLSILNWTG